MTKQPVSRTERPAKVPLHTVMDALRTIHDKGDSDHFMKEAQEAGAVVTVHPKTLSFVKKYIKSNNLHTHAATNNVVVCKQPYNCPNVHNG
jgi:hypothetical protein